MIWSSKISIKISIVAAAALAVVFYFNQKAQIKDPLSAMSEKQSISLIKTQKITTTEIKSTTEKPNEIPTGIRRAHEKKNAAIRNLFNLSDLEVLAELRTKQDSAGYYKRILILKSSPPIKETQLRHVDWRSGVETLLRSHRVIADHLIVRLKPGHYRQELEIIARKYRARIRAASKIQKNLFVVAVSGHEPENLHNVLEALKEDLKRQNLISLVSEDVLMGL